MARREVLEALEDSGLKPMARHPQGEHGKRLAFRLPRASMLTLEELGRRDVRGGSEPCSPRPRDADRAESPARGEAIFAASRHHG